VIQFHVYINGKPTKGIFDSLSQAQKSYNKEATAGEKVEIQTVNSLGPVERWYFDKEIGQWIKGA